MSRVRTELLKNASRLVLKLGTGVLTNEHKQPDPAQIEQLAAQVAQLHAAGRKIVLVTSGAVGAGMGVLGFQKRPTALADLQACAAVGQSRLMAMYEQVFARWQVRVAQVLLTHDDLEHHDRHLNARNTLVALLNTHNVIPIINENDAVSFTELRFGDNDRLSALVATLLPADLLVILTTVEGVLERFGQPDAKVLSVVERIDETLEGLAGGTASATAVGGMATKIQAAKIVARAGIPMVIASGRKPGVLAAILAGADEGTLFIPQQTRLAGRKRWIAFFHHPRGALVVDDGAKQALREGGKSLLPPGITACEGQFAAGDVVAIRDADGTEFARGIAKFSAEEIRGRQLPRSEVIHRDDLVIL
jgi:glutamate 5-kinase